MLKGTGWPKKYLNIQTKDVVSKHDSSKNEHPRPRFFS
jgi:hypothetical protein